MAVLARKTGLSRPAPCHSDTQRSRHERSSGHSARLKRSQRFAFARMRGRPPFLPFLRAAAALAADDRRPPTRPNSAIHWGPANTDDTRPGTLRSRSRLSQCSPLPRPSTSTDCTSVGAARFRCGISFTGIVIAAPLVSSISSAAPRVRYRARAALGSVFAAHRPAAEARAKAERTSLFAHSGIPMARMLTKRLGFSATLTVPNSSELDLGKPCKLLF